MRGTQRIGGIADLESPQPRRVATRKLQLRWKGAEENILADVWRLGVGGGFSAAVLVGVVCDDSDRVCELVGGVPKRLVLKHTRCMRNLSGDSWSSSSKWNIS